MKGIAGYCRKTLDFFNKEGASKERKSSIFMKTRQLHVRISPQRPGNSTSTEDTA
jgi:hypothetical protein